MEWTRANNCTRDHGCLEAARWHKGGNDHDHILLRSSNNESKLLLLTVNEWTAFLTGAQAGDFNDV